MFPRTFTPSSGSGTIVEVAGRGPARRPPTMALLPTPTYRTDDLDVTRGPAGELVTELSQFHSGLRLGRVYDDACDEGLTLQSHLTGALVQFALYEEHRDREGDVLKWEFRSVRPDPALVLIVLND